MGCCQLRQCVTLNHLKSCITAKDLIKCLGDSFLIQFIIMHQVSLLLSWVENNNAWHWVLLQVECLSEFLLLTDIQSDEVKCDSSLNLTCEGLFNILECREQRLITLFSILYQVDDTQHSIFLKAKVIGTLFAHEGNGLCQPRLRGSTLSAFLGLAKDKCFRVSVNELKDFRICEASILVLNWLLLVILQNEKTWVGLDSVPGGKSGLIRFDHTKK